MNMLILRILDAVFLICLGAALSWLWRHQETVRRKILLNDAMPREASRGLIYGLLIFVIVGAVMVSVYWLF